MHSPLIHFFLFLSFLPLTIIELYIIQAEHTELYILQAEFKIFRIIFVLAVINFLLCFKKEILTAEKVLITYKKINELSSSCS